MYPDRVPGLGVDLQLEPARCARPRALRPGSGTDLPLAAGEDQGWGA